ncbi:MAG: hypothetical protein A2583_08925 [Bdellovibrionales bacterium RIFOXYD1_FULL_53_11]|nr:MAG: hypothetical protein A2583_08925 [Bdellovibrionales bacterium RIFOXYD1_FULL_53_11]
MNIKLEMSDMRWQLSRHSVGVWGYAKTAGKYVGGTGFLLNFRGKRLVVSCDHILNKIDDIIYVSFSRENYQDRAIHRYIETQNTIDMAFIELQDNVSLPHRDMLTADDVQTNFIDPDCAVYVYGFPNGHRKIQEGWDIKEDVHEAHLRSVTYLSITESKRYNSSLKITQPTIRWVNDENISSKTFKRLYFPLDPHGFSGGPVFLANPKKLIGHVTHCDENQRFYYTPIKDTLDAIDKLLNH